MKSYAPFLLLFKIQVLLSCNKPITESPNSAEGTTEKTTAKTTTEIDDEQPTVMKGCEGTKSSSTFTEHGLACIFPFFDGANEYKACANWRGKYMWCATYLRNNCNYLKWAKCLDQATTTAAASTTTTSTTSTTSTTTITTTATKTTTTTTKTTTTEDVVSSTTREKGAEEETEGEKQESIANNILMGVELEEKLPICTVEEEITECLNDRKKRSAECSSEPSSTCAAEGGYCSNPANCPNGNVVHNKCPGGNDNKCCLTIPYQESPCEEEGGQCVDRCGCQGETLHGFCPGQPDSIKCCKTSESASTVGACVAQTPSALNCPGGTTSNCINGDCTVICSGGNGGQAAVGGSGGEEENAGKGENGESAGNEGGSGSLSCSGGYNTNCNNGKCTVSCSGGSGNNNYNNNGRKKRSTCKKPACSKYKDCVSCFASLSCHWGIHPRKGIGCLESSSQKVARCDACAVCDQWYTNEREVLDAPGDNWLKEVNRMFKCPCEVQKDKPDGVFKLPTSWDNDRACPLIEQSFSTNKCDEYHPGAVGCIRSAKTPKGAGQQCCYDKSGQIIDPDAPGRKGLGAGTPDRVWAAGNIFTVLGGLISGEHKAYDVNPYEWCCKQCKNGQDDARCKKYYQGARKLDISHC